jgi:cell division protein FtsQ
VTVLDPRIARRRRLVAEHHARRRVRRLVLILVAGVVVGVVAWALQSPFLSVRTIRVEGAEQAPVRSLMTDAGFSKGRPLVTIRPSEVEAVLEQHPWIAEAVATVRFPDTLDVEVREREAVGWARTNLGWLLLSARGVPVELSERPGAGNHGLISISVLDPVLGERHPEDMVRGAAAFLAAFPERHRGGITVRVLDGELWARLDGIEARLGSAEDMKAKAVALRAMMAEVPPGSTVTVISPSYPAVRLPRGQSEAAEAASDPTG